MTTITAAGKSTPLTGAVDGGAADYLIKPFEFDQLKTKLEAFAARADALKSADGVDQSLIDSLFGAAGAQPHQDVLPKGLGAETGRLVLDAVREAGEVSAAECAERVGSRGSALVAISALPEYRRMEIRLQYGAGSPERAPRRPLTGGVLSECDT